MDELFLKNLSDKLLPTFRYAGDLALKYRQVGLKETIKEDNTPVTNADIEINDILTKNIEKLTPKIPIISEEVSKNKNLKNLSTFWLIDPIDGTYDYINNRSEFTLNAALIINKKAELGIIHAPAQKRLFFTHGSNSFEIRQETFIKLTCEKKTKQDQIKAVSYSENLKPIIADVHKKYGVTEYKKMKSSLKFCVIAAGEFDLYVAEPRASEWDIAAGHAILKNAGGIITDYDGNEIVYGKKDFKNPGLILRRSNKL
jgi:3'(2'), 5'-bisphosphate nucleotidase